MSIIFQRPHTATQQNKYGMHPPIAPSPINATFMSCFPLSTILQIMQMGIDWDGVYEIGSPKALDARQCNITC